MTRVKVTAGKPKVGGAAFRGAFDTTLPVNAMSELAKGFKSLGYISDDGVTNENTMSTETTKAWGGDVVMTSQTEKNDRFKFKLIEALNIDVLKTVFGDANVSGDLEHGLTIKVNAAEQETRPWVFDMILRGGVLKRIVIPFGTICEVGEIQYSDSSAIGYEITIQTEPDIDGNTHYEYMVNKTASAVVPGGEGSDTGEETPGGEGSDTGEETPGGEGSDTGEEVVE